MDSWHSETNAKISLAAFYFSFCAVLGAVFSYWGLYLANLNYSVSQIGMAGGVFLAANIVATNVWAYWAQKIGNRTITIRIGLFFALIFFVTSQYIHPWFWLHLVFYGAFSACFQGVVAQVEVIVLGLSNGISNYGGIRVWGSFGFILSASAIGLLLETISINNLPYIVSPLILITLMSTIGFPEEPDFKTCRGLKFPYQVFTRRNSWIIFFVIASLNFSLGSYYTFFSLYLDNHGYSKPEISFFWTVAVISEILMFFVTKHFVKQNNLENLLILSLLLTVMRWALIALIPTDATSLFIAQTLHAFSFALAHTAGIAIVGDIFGKSHAGRGIAFYSAILVSGSAALGALVGGWLWAFNPTSVFSTSAAIVICASCLLIYHKLNTSKLINISS